MAWHVRFKRQGGIPEIARFPTLEHAIEEAVRLFDDGSDVLGIGVDQMSDSIDFSQFRFVYEMQKRAWSR